MLRRWIRLVRLLVRILGLDLEREDGFWSLHVGCTAEEEVGGRGGFVICSEYNAHFNVIQPGMDGWMDGFICIHEKLIGGTSGMRNEQ